MSWEQGNNCKSSVSLYGSWRQRSGGAWTWSCNTLSRHWGHLFGRNFWQRVDLFYKHVTTVVRRCFYLRQLRTVRKSLTTEAAKTVVHALIASRIDCCNSVFYRISAANLQALQSVLNASARLVMRKWKFDHITATLHARRSTLHGYQFVSE